MMDPTWAYMEIILAAYLAFLLATNIIPERKPKRRGPWERSS